MLLTLCLVALLFALAVVAVAALALQLVRRRFGLEPMTVLLWFGLAEEPTRQPRAARPRLSALTADPFAATRG